MDVQAEAKEVGTKVQKAAAHAQESVAQGMDSAQNVAGQLDAQLRDAMRSYPVICLFAALSLGYSLGRLVARR